MVNHKNIVQHEWQTIRSAVKKVNPTLTEIIDLISPNKDFKLFKAVYNYGSHILHNGKIYLPEGDCPLELSKSAVDHVLKNELCYNVGTNPVSLILKNTTEIYMIVENFTIPLYGLIEPGKIFSTWRVLSQGHTHAPAFLWNMTAGARSIFLLPKISDTLNYNKLRQRYHLETDKPKKLLDHWKVFKEISNHQNFESKWNTEILFFSKKWFENLNDPIWLPFKNYLIQQGWAGSEFFRNQYSWDLIFSIFKNNREIKPDPYVADTVKHLIAMSASALPGFVPATNDVAGPIKMLQQVFNDIYNIEYDPIIMHTGFLNYRNNNSVYYSLDYPIMAQFSPRSREKVSKITELYETMSLLNKYIKDVLSDKYNLKGTLFYEATKKTEYHFFHPDYFKYSHILSNTKIQEGDNAFKGASNFPSTSSFFSGCIRVRSVI